MSMTKLPEEAAKPERYVRIFEHEDDKRPIWEGSMARVADFEFLQSVKRLSQDLAKAAATLSTEEARYLVDAYYALQRRRIASDNQIRALTKSVEPHEVLKWFSGQAELLESQVRRALDRWSDAHHMGRWCKAVTGLGPVITAGLLAHIDIEKSPTVGHIWSFAGLNPDPKKAWKKGEKRPFNSRLKVLVAYKLGESFVKVQNNEHDVYGKMFVQRKLDEQGWNEEGGPAPKNTRYDEARNEWVQVLPDQHTIFPGSYVTQATTKLKNFKIGDDTRARDWYDGRISPAIARWWRLHGCDTSSTPTIKQVEDFVSGKTIPKGAVEKVNYKELADWLKTQENDKLQPYSPVGQLEGQPMLPPAHIHSRARRYAVKQFLADFHGEAFREKFGKEPPLPYPVEKMGHTHIRKSGSLEGWSRAAEQ